MKEALKKVKPKHVASGGAVGALSMVGYKFFESPELVEKFFGQAASNQIIQAGFFFCIASWLHSGRVKKEIAKNFASLTDSINNLAETFRADLNAHSSELKKNSEELANLSVRVQNVENNLNLNKKN